MLVLAHISCRNVVAPLDAGLLLLRPMVEILSALRGSKHSIFAAMRVFIRCGLKQKKIVLALSEVQ